jgi:hypothetical protein
LGDERMQGLVLTGWEDGDTDLRDKHGFLVARIELRKMIVIGMGERIDTRQE